MQKKTNNDSVEMMLWQNIRRISKICTIIVSTHVTSKKYNTSYQEIVPTMYDFVDGSNHGYTLCMTSCSWMRLNLHRIILPPYRIHILGHMKICDIAECHFQHQLSVNMWCRVLGNNLIGPHVIEGCSTAPY
jgi:hypothetical protein